MLNVKYCRIFVTSFLCSLKFFIVAFDREYKEVSTKKIFNILHRSVCVI